MLAIILLFGCKENEVETPVIFEPDREASSIEGSFVQNTTVSSAFFNLHYIGSATSATISAKESNGLFVSECNLELPKDGPVRVTIEGKPIELGEFSLKLEIKIHEKIFYCAQSFEVFEDTDPDALIEFNIEEQYLNIKGLAEALEIPFTVSPSMSSVVVATPVAGIITKITTDKKTGEGVLTITPNEDFILGELVLSASFGARQPVQKTITMAAFANGDGNETPYEINSVALLKKVRTLSDKKFILIADIDMTGSAWSPVGTVERPFTGILDGNGKSIININLSGTTNVALFAYTGSSAEIKNLTVSGIAKGTDYIAGLVANNAGTITNCTATEVTVEGNNFLSGIAARNTGTITGSTPDAILDITNLPAMIPDITTTITRTIAISPSGATITIVTQPENATASITGNVLTITPEAGFVTSEMTVKVEYQRLSTAEKTIQLYAEEQFDDGDGSVTNPFKVSKATQFNKIREYPDKAFLLTADINLADLEAWEPITAFSGTLDGGNKQINGLTIASTALKGGLIIDNTGNIKNVAIPNIDINATAAFGVIVGDHRTGTIENVVITGKLVSSNTGDLLGGVAAEILSGAIHNVYVDLEIEATCGMVGGIVGRARSSASTVSNCTAKGRITIGASKTRVAGIVGRGETGVIIKNCLSDMALTTTVTGSNGFGGIFGANNSNAMQIEECMFTGTISGVFMSGGIAGVAANIINCVVDGEETTPAVASAMFTSGGTASTSTIGGICGTGKVIVSKCIIRNAAFTGSSTTSFPLAGISSTFQDGGYVTNCVVDNVLINATNVHGIAGTPGNTSGVHAGNYTGGLLYYEGGVASAYVPTDDAAGLDGGIKTSAELTQSFYESLGYDFGTIWSWEGDKPVLRNVGYKGSVPVN